MSLYTANNVADWFLYQDEMSPKKLQKLVYYAYAWSLVFFNESSDTIENRLFNEKIEAWVHGPVVRELYVKYKPFGYRNIDQKPEEEPKFDEEIKDVLEQVWDMYGGFNGNQLESLSHNEKPWEEARGDLLPLDSSNQNLNDKTIFEFYGSRLGE